MYIIHSKNEMQKQGMYRIIYGMSMKYYKKQGKNQKIVLRYSINIPLSALSPAIVLL